MKKNSVIFIVITFVVCLFLSVLVELFVFNKSVLKENKKYDASVIETHDIKEENGWYITTSDKAFIKFKTNTNYIERLCFDYKASNDFSWSLTYKLNGQKIKSEQVSSSLINKTTRKLKINSDVIKLNINSKNVRIRKISINNKIYFNISHILFLTILLFSLTILLKFRNYFYNNLDKAFLYISIICGISMILFAPKYVYTSYDDQIHFKRVNSILNQGSGKISEAYMIVESQSKINDSLFQTNEEKVELYKSLNRIDRKTKNQTFQFNNYSKIYTRIIYIPYYLGLKLARIFNFSFITSIILSKIFNLMCYIGMLYYAIKISTYAKKIIFVCSLLVSNMFLASQFSYDPLITSSLVLAISLFLRTIEMDKIDYKYIIIFILSVILASLSKPIYCPILLLLLFVSKDKFESHKQSKLFKICVIALTLVLLSSFVLPLLLGSVSGDVRGGNTNASAQVKYILTNPISYIILLMKYSGLYFMSFIFSELSISGVGYLGIYSHKVSSFLTYMQLILLFYVTFNNKIDKKIVSNKYKIIFGILYLGIYLLIVTALYVSFTPVAYSTINGVQCRYFNPLLPLVLIILTPTIDKLPKIKEKNNYLLLLVPYLSLMITIFTFVFVGHGI